MSLKVNLGYCDAPAALNFLLNVLGFQPVVVYTGAHQGIIAHAEIRWPEGGAVTLHSIEEDEVSVYDAVQAMDKKGGYPAFSVHMETSDPDKLYQRAVEEGAEIIKELDTTSRGRGFIVADPEGLYWSFGTPLPKLLRNAEGEWQPEDNA
ncbi:MAG: glyoxalase [Sphingobacteriaceae bacterium]|jgi:uncharacterized glyoxalase superfamily protein PhnB|nr:glyoxalase [Sphingobacteriaceae bacterium]